MAANDEHDDDRLLADNDDPEKAVTSGANPDFNDMMHAIYAMSESVRVLADNTKVAAAKRARHTVSDSESDADSYRHCDKRARSTSSSDGDADDVAALLKPSTSACSKRASSQLLDDIARELDDVKMGPPVSEHVAKIANKRFSSKMKLETIKEKKELYVPPSNCEWLKVPLCNKDVFNQMKRYHKSRATSLIRIQSDISKVGIILTQVAHTVTMAEDGEKPLSHTDLLRKITDAIALLGTGFMNVSQHRRDLAVSALHRDYHQISELNSSPDFLFGEASELTKKMKEIKELQKMGRPINYHSNFNKPSKNWRSYRDTPPYKSRGKYRKYQGKPGKK